MSYDLDKEAYKRRVEIIESYIKSSSKELQNCTSLFILAGSSKDENEQLSKGAALQTWLFGYEFPDTLMLFTPSKFHVFASQKKVDILKQLQDASAYPLVLHVRAKDDSTTNDKFEEFVAACKSAGSHTGVFEKDKPTGAFFEKWRSFSSNHSGWKSQTIVDLSTLTSYFFGTKDESELQIIRDSADIANHVVKNFVFNKVENFINRGRKVTNSELADELEKLIKDPPNLKKDFDKSAIELSYSPIVQSGGKYNLNPSAQSNDDLMVVGTVLVSIGVQYKQYNSNVSRTFLVNATKRQKDNYTFLLQVQEKVISLLEPGTKLSDIYAQGVEFVRQERPDLVEKLTANFGFGIGLEFRETSLILNEKATRTVERGMVFNIAIGFKNLQDADKDVGANPPRHIESNYALFVADMVAISLNDNANLNKNKNNNNNNNNDDDDDEISVQNNRLQMVLTEKSPKDLKHIHHVLQDEETKDEKRRRRQNELLEKIIESKQNMIEREGESSASKKFDKSVAYPPSSRFPPDDPDVKKLQIYVDVENRAVILPIYGYPVPFHINMIKSVSRSEQANYHFLRINFTIPTQNTKETTANVPSAVFLGEVNFRSKNSEAVAEIDRKIKALQKLAKAEAAEKKEKEDLVPQEELQLVKGRTPPRLAELQMRPPLIGRGRETGFLEAHMNGFRYMCRGERCDIIYSNIKHAILQQCRSENVVILHFNLKNPILVGKKKFKDIQFYVEVIGVDDLSQKKRGNTDRDEFESEQRERELKNRYNEAFAKFAGKVQELTNKAVTFDAPEREFGFTGVPFRTTAFITPGTNCLFNVTEQPVFVVSLDEIELVHLERVQMNLRSFDMVIVYKDYTKPVSHISAIPIEYLDTIREWLDAVDIYCTQGPQTLNWSAIMKTILDDPKSFIEDGAWGNFLGEEENDEDQSDSEEEDSEFEGDTEDSEESSDEEYDSEESDFDSSEDDDDSDNLGSDEESGKDWDELEEEAIREEELKKRRHEADSDSDDNSRRKKTKVEASKKSGRR